MHPGLQDPDRPAVVMAGSGEVTTYAELDAAANRVARLLRAQGLVPGDHVALCVDNTPAFFALVWGAHYAGLLYTACSTQLTPDELAFVIDDCGARVAILAARRAGDLGALRAGAPRVERWLTADGSAPGLEAYEDAVAGLEPTPLAEERIAGRDMLYSSGTTGRPKGIRPTAPVLPLDEAPIVVTPLLRDLLGRGARDVYLSPAPLYHAAPLRFCLAFHQLGATVVVMERWDAAAALALIDAHRVTVTQLVPTMFVRLLRLPASVRGAARLDSLEVVIHAAAPCPAEVKEQMLDWWGEIIHEYYSSTEACGLTWATPAQWRAHPGTVGRAVLGVPHVTGAGGEELAAGRDGEVWFSDGPAFAYHRDAARTAEVTDERGWQTFGDIGHLDADGFLHLTDRKAHTIIRGGVNVYPQEAEDALQAHPEVMDAAVIGIPDAELGEVVHAVVEPVRMPADAAEAAALEARLLAHCRSRLARVKCPVAVELRPGLPRTATGKLLKRLLRDEHAAGAPASRAPVG